ncbi:MAG: hypothetical protein Q8Q09_07775 [Deltaproteobacteria bacterium]|nr:hypothetical protein [Deltaproteobacteria bacterium]
MNISQHANRALGDISGRSISRTIGDGLALGTGGALTGAAATEVAHLAMIVGLTAPLGNPKAGATIAIGIGAVLLTGYVIGRSAR